MSDQDNTPVAVPMIRSIINEVEQAKKDGVLDTKEQASATYGKTGAECVKTARLCFVKKHAELERGKRTSHALATADLAICSLFETGKGALAAVTGSSTEI